MTPKKSSDIESIESIETNKIEKIIAKSIARDVLNSYQD